MSAWMGLHHPERHRVTAIDGYAECNICGTGCAIDGACRCCLAAEVEALRAQVQRVRELRDRFRDHEKWTSYRNAALLRTRALEGDA